MIRGWVGFCAEVEVGRAETRLTLSHTASSAWLQCKPMRRLRARSEGDTSGHSEPFVAFHLKATPNSPQLLQTAVENPLTSSIPGIPLFFRSAEPVQRGWGGVIKLMQHGCQKVVDISRVEQFSTLREEVRACIKPHALAQIYYAFSLVICDIIRGVCQ